MLKSEPTNAELLAQATGKKIAEKYNLNLEQGIKLFENSKLGKDLRENPEDYNRMVPLGLLDMWTNERIFGYPISTYDIQEGALRDEDLK